MHVKIKLKIILNPFQKFIFRALSKADFKNEFHMHLKLTIYL
jgi:hypothetical protein